MGAAASKKASDSAPSFSRIRSASASERAGCYDDVAVGNIADLLANHLDEGLVFDAPLHCGGKGLTVDGKGPSGRHGGLFRARQQ